MYRGLSSYFYDRVGFGLVQKEETALVKRFKITRFPTIMVYQTHEEYTMLDEVSTKVYSGQNKAKHIGGFIEFFALPEKKYITNRNKEFRFNPVKRLGKTDLKDYLKKMEGRRVVVLWTIKDDISDDLVKFASMMK